MKSKKVPYIIGGIIVLLILFIIIARNSLLAPLFAMFQEEETSDPYIDDIEYIYNSGIESDLIIYGDDMTLREDMPYRRINEIKETNICSDADYVFLIINDRSGTVDFDIEMLRFLKNYADANMRFNFAYIGSDKMNLYTSGEVFEEYSYSSEDMSYGYILYEGFRIQYGGLWSADDEKYYEDYPQGLFENLIYFMKNVIKSNE